MCGGKRGRGRSDPIRCLLLPPRRIEAVWAGTDDAWEGEGWVALGVWAGPVKLWAGLVGVWVMGGFNMWAWCLLHVIRDA